MWVVKVIVIFEVQSPSVSTYNLAVRSAGVRYLRDHPEQFIEFVDEQSWSDYLNNMSRQGTWFDAVIVQAVADCYNLSVHTIESAETFSETTIVEPHEPDTEPTSIFIGHLDEYHYVSTIPATDLSRNLQCNKRSLSFCNGITSEIQSSGRNNFKTQPFGHSKNSPVTCESKGTFNNNEVKMKHNAHVRDFMRRQRADVHFRQKENAALQQKRKENIDKTREDGRIALKKIL